MCFGARGALPFFDGHYHVFRFDVDSGVIHGISFFKFFRHLVDGVEMFFIQHVLIPHGVERQMKPTLHHHGGYGRSTRQLFASFRTRTVTDPKTSKKVALVLILLVLELTHQLKNIKIYPRIQVNSQRDTSTSFHNLDRSWK